MPLYDLLLKGGTVIDGQRPPRYTSDVAIADGRIAQIGRVCESDAARVVDAGDLIVAPGFIDLHAHFDSQIFWDPYCTMSGLARGDLGGHRQLRLRRRPHRGPCNGLLARRHVGRDGCHARGRQLAVRAAGNLRRRCPHEIPDHRSLPDRLHRQAGPRQRPHGLRTGPLAALGLLRHRRRVHRPRFPARRGSRRHRGLRLRRVASPARGATVRLPRRRLAPSPEGRGLPGDHRQRRGHLRGQRMHYGHLGGFTR